MTRSEAALLVRGITIGLRKARELFRNSSKGECQLLTKQSEGCKCFKCLLDQEIVDATKEMQS